MSDFWHLSRSRQMCRSYQDKPIPRAHLLRVLEAARKAPSAGHSQGVRFAVVLDPVKRQQIAQAYGEESYRSRGVPPWLSVAPVHVVVAVCEQAYRDRYSQPDKVQTNQHWPIAYSVLDGGKALMNLYLAARALNIDCGYLGPHAGPNLISMLDLPSDWTYLGLVTLGYRTPRQNHQTSSQKRGWRPFDEVVHWIF